MARPLTLSRRFDLKRKLAAVAGGIALLVGGIAGVAVADNSATVQTFPYTVPGYTVNPQTYTQTITVPTVTQTVTNTVTVNQPNTKFNGNASQMTQLSRSSSSDPGTQSPSVWTCLCFINNDISLTGDNTFGKAYNVAVKTGDTNGFGGSDPSDGAGQLSIRQPNDLGTTDYYSLAVKVNSWNGPMSDLFFADLASFGYQTSENDQVALQVWNGPNDAGPLQWAIQSNAGYVNAPSSWAPGTTNYEEAFGNVTYGQWTDFVVAVHWATDTSGSVQVYQRTPGGSWSKVYDKENVATELYGTTQSGTFAQDGSNWPTIIDKIGLYFKEYGGESESVQESGLVISPDLATAEAQLP